MIYFVLDCSMVTAWGFPDESTQHTQAVLNFLKTDERQAVAPILLRYELNNAMLNGVRKGRIDSVHAITFFAFFDGLPLEFDRSAQLGDIFDIARRHSLAAYDAAYLELALRLQLPVATLDRRMAHAAMDAGVRTFRP